MQVTRKARTAPTLTPPAQDRPAAPALPAGPGSPAAGLGRLDRLEVRNLATIRELDLGFQGGLSVFTGETGAGKSIIVDALGLLLGARANTDLIRTGEDALLVTGFWQGGPGGEEFSASRRVTQQGRSVARLEGEVVSVRELQEWAQAHLTIHWQHSAVSLLTSANQRQLLDRQVPDAARAYTAAYAAWQDAARRHAALLASERERARQLDLLTFQAQEIAQVAPQTGEEEPLQAELNRLANLDTIAQGAAGALTLLTDGDENAGGFLAEAIRRGGRARAPPPPHPPAQGPRAQRPAADRTAHRPGQPAGGGRRAARRGRLERPRPGGARACRGAPGRPGQTPREVRPPPGGRAGVPRGR